MAIILNCYFAFFRLILLAIFLPLPPYFWLKFFLCNVCNTTVCGVVGIIEKEYIGIGNAKPVQPRRANNLSALMIERGQFSAVYFLFLEKNMRIKKMTSLDYNN